MGKLGSKSELIRDMEPGMLRRYSGSTSIFQCASEGISLVSNTHPTSQHIDCELLTYRVSYKGKSLELTGEDLFNFFKQAKLRI